MIKIINWSPGNNYEIIKSQFKSLRTIEIYEISEALNKSHFIKNSEIGFWYLEMDFKNFKMQVLIKVLRFLQASYLKFIRMRLVLSQDKALIINLRNLKVIQLLNKWSF